MREGCSRACAAATDHPASASISSSESPAGTITTGMGKLAAATGTEGPGPLVSAIAGKSAATFPIPVVIVPGGLTDEEIDALAG